MKTKFTLLLVIATISSINIFSQPAIIKQTSTGGNTTDILQCIIPTADTGIIAGGYSYSNKSGNKSEDSKGNNGTPDYWIVKYDRTGKIEWDKTIGGFATDELFTIQQTADNGYIIGGRSASGASGDKSENSKGDFDCWIIKLSAEGVIEWDKTLGGNKNESLRSVKQTTDGGYIIGGTSFSDQSGDKTENSKGGLDYWVVKLDASGNIQWNKTIGGSGTDFNCIVLQTPDGGYIAGGNSSSDISGDRTAYARGGADFWIVKLDANGNILWDKAYGSMSDEIMNAMQLTTEGGYILGGFSPGSISGEKTQKSRGSDDYWIVKTDAAGNVQWNKTIGGKKGDYLQSIELTSYGDYLLAGYSWSNISGEKTENTKDGNGNFSDYWLVLLNKNGKVKSDKTIGSLVDDYCFGAVEIYGKLITGGYTAAEISGDKTRPSNGSVDYWIVQLNPRLNMIANNAITESKTKAGIYTPVTVYPNPAGNIITVTGISANTNIKITSVNGKTVHRQTISANTQINISKILPGAYILTYKNGNTYNNIHFIKR